MTSEEIMFLYLLIGLLLGVYLWFGKLPHDHRNWGMGVSTLTFLIMAILWPAPLILEIFNRLYYSKDQLDFYDYTRDHVEHFNAIPCEFETASGHIWDADRCWEEATKLKLHRWIMKEYTEEEHNG